MDKTTVIRMFLYALMFVCGMALQASFSSTELQKSHTELVQTRTELFKAQRELVELKNELEEYKAREIIGLGR